MTPSVRRPNAVGWGKCRVGGAITALGVLFLSAGGCATTGATGVAGAPPDPLAVHRAVLGRNEGLSSLRAVVEARISFAGNQLSLPGVVQMQRAGGFRLDLLDPLDRPVLILFPEERNIVQYRPSLKFAASLSPFANECRGLDSASWVAAVLAGSPVPVAGEQERLGRLWGKRYLTRSWQGELRQSVRYEEAGEELRPTLVSWYCAGEPVLQLKILDWQRDPSWRLPSRIEIDYLKAGLQIQIELKETEANPPPNGEPLLPPIGSDTIWSVWNLPQ